MPGMTLWLDSGAFSAWNSGTEIDLDHYIAFIKANIEHLDYYVNLDVIPGSFGVVPTAAEVEASAEASWQNMLLMEAEGLKPIPVFHMGEQFKWLRRMVEHGCEYIGISPANDRTTAAKRVWLDRVFHEITDAAGHPVVRTHAFGVTAIDLLIRYPWYSADSTTWIMIAARGRILMPQWENERWNFQRRPKIVYTSLPFGDEKTQVRGLQLSDWRNIKSEYAHVLKWLEEAGSTLKAVEENHYERVRVCCYFFQRFEAEFVAKPFKRTKVHFFEDA